MSPPDFETPLTSCGQSAFWPLATSSTVLAYSPVSLLGVCLGHQALAEVYGARIVRAERLMHGKTSPIRHDGQTIFRDLPQPFTAMRYHSLVVEPATLPDDLAVSSRTPEGEIMGLRHRPSGAEGVQFHPESILTEVGDRLLANFVDQR